MAYAIDKETMQNIVTLVAVALGWILGEATGFIKKRGERNKIIDALRVELADCSSWLQRNKLTLEDMIRLTTLGHTSEAGPVDVPTHIYQKYFPDVSIHLSQNERISFNSIHNLIKISHEQNRRLIELRFVYASDPSKVKEYNEILEGAFHNVSMALWQIGYHITHKSKINVYAVSGEDAKKIDEAIENRMKELITEATQTDAASIRAASYKT